MRCMRSLLLCLFALVLPVQAQQQVELWTYHELPPFIIDAKQGKGLSYDLLRLLNEHPQNAGRFHFVLQQLPRRRIDLYLDQRRAGVVPWVDPEFFDDAGQQRFLWTESLFEDRQEIVSSIARPVEYDGNPESLSGLRIGGILGHRYAAIDPLVEAGKVHREDVLRELQNVQKLHLGRIDLFFSPWASLSYYRQTQQLGALYVSNLPLYRFRRQLLMSPALPVELVELLRAVIADLPQQPRWQQLLSQYGLQSPASSRAR